MESATSKLDDDPPYAVEGLLTFLYTLDYPLGTLRTPSTTFNVTSETTESNSKTSMPQIFQPSEGHQSKQARQKRAEAGCKSVTPEHAWQFHLALFKLADKVLLGSLAKLAGKKLARSCEESSRDPEIFIAILTELWSTDQHGLEKVRSLALRNAVRIADTLSQASSFDALIQTCPDFGVQLIRKLANKTNSVLESSAAPTSQTATGQTPHSFRTSAFPSILPRSNAQVSPPAPPGSLFFSNSFPNFTF